MLFALSWEIFSTHRKWLKIFLLHNWWIKEFKGLCQGFFTPILNPLIRNKGRLGNFKLNIIGVYQCHFIQYNDDPIGSAKVECSSWHHFKNHMIQTIFKFHLRQIFISALLVSACPPVLRVLWQGEAGTLCQLQRCPGRSGWRITLRSPASPPGVLRLLQPLWPMACRGVVPCE